MSYLAAILLLFLDTYQAFEGLANMMAADASSLLQLYKMNTAHNSTMFNMFDEIMKEVLPKIWYHLKKHGVLVDMYLLPW
tara:strand:+ start:125 stop:364 length:240 start_codon:yes stop_codon:yes gene_type:complete